MLAHPMFWPVQVYAFWLNMFALPWMQASQGADLPAAAGAIPATAPMGPAAAAGLDPVSATDIGTSATDFR